MGSSFQTINPTTAEIIQTYSYLTDAQCILQLEQTHKSFLTWSHRSLQDRQAHILKLVDLLKQNKEALAHSMTQEMGKPIVQSLAEVEKCIQLIYFCVEQSKTTLAVRYEKGFELHFAPQGVILGIMPWNFPLWQTFRCVIPNLLAGNSLLIKPADNVAGTALLLQSILKDVQLAEVCKHLLLTHEQCAQLMTSPLIRGVSLTGSTRAGQSVAKAAGRSLKKVVLELGGNDAYVICEDADLDTAAEKIFQARILNAGQSCISAKRILAHKNIIQPLTEKLIDFLEKIKIGDPLLNQCELGPIARQDLLTGLVLQLETLKKLGAVVVYQKELPQMRGFFLAPVILQWPSTLHFEDEVFGPIFSLIPFENDEQAIALANSTPYGLGGAVFSRDSHRAFSIAKAMDTGSVAINDFFRSSPERPFGGVKNSGYGRELGEDGFYEFINKKVIVR